MKTTNEQNSENNAARTRFLTTLGWTLLFLAVVMLLITFM